MFKILSLFDDIVAVVDLYTVELDWYIVVNGKNLEMCLHGHGWPFKHFPGETNDKYETRASG